MIMPFFKPINEGFLDKMKSNLEKVKAAGPSGVAKAYVNAGKRLLGNNQPVITHTKRVIAYDDIPDAVKRKLNPDGTSK